MFYWPEFDYFEKETDLVHAGMPEATGRKPNTVERVWALESKSIPVLLFSSSVSWDKLLL